MFFKFFQKQKTVDLAELKSIFKRFQQILAGNNIVLELIAQLEDKLSGEYIFDINYLKKIIYQISAEIYRVIYNLNRISTYKYNELYKLHSEIHSRLERIINSPSQYINEKFILRNDEINSYDVESVGAKIANLGELKNHLKLLIPDGFVITTSAYFHFMEYNNLWAKINSIYSASAGEKKINGNQYNQKVDSLFNTATIPEDLQRSITKNLNTLSKRNKKKTNLAIRSSAYGEDNDNFSFAGQFESILDCHTDDVFSSYIKVLSSRFKYNIFVYGEEHMLNKNRLPMAVGVQQLIHSKTSGVIYTYDPLLVNTDNMIISATFGLGVDVVSGKINADYFKVSRLEPNRIIERKIVKKSTEYVDDGSGKIVNIPVTDNMQNVSCLTDEQVFELAEVGLYLDRYFKRPLDIEWCYNEDNQLYILQCRPLKIIPKKAMTSDRLKDILSKKKTIMYHKGQIAQRGITAGIVRQVQEDDDPLSFPVGGIAVTKYTTPRLSGIIHRARAIITDIGSTTSHMATVAREFGVPLIVNSENATRLLQNGSEITVDAEENIIYEGIIHELLEYEAESEDVFRDLKEYQILRQLLRKISPLTMTDPKSPHFISRNCKTYHDILRFSHEKAMQELIELNTSSNRFKGIKAIPINLSIPLGLSIINLGGGLSNDSIMSVIDSIDQISSIPMQALLKGLTSPGVWTTQPVQFGFGDLISSMTRYSVTDRVDKSSGQNLAVISEKYMNLSLRLGYHFNVIDTYVSDNVNDNYIYFRFVGGVTESERRHLRAILLKEILERLNFKVIVKGDLVTARIKKWDAEKILDILEKIGKLIGFSRQLDTKMQNNDSVKRYLNEFFKDNKSHI
jgi:pyruvate,water dikinase